MARTPKPWFWEARGEWFVTICGQGHRLGPNKKEAFQQFHQLMAEKPKPKTTQVEGPVVLEILDKFLDWCNRRREPRTYKDYKEKIQRFLDFKPDFAQLPAMELKPYHVIEWVDAFPDWSSTYRRGCIIAVQRPFNWAEELGYIERNPIKSIKKPNAKRRETPITAEDYRILIEHATSPFRELLIFSWESGCRPQEARLLEANHVSLTERRIEIPPNEAKGKKRWRIIYLTDTAFAIIEALVKKFPKGKIFRNAKGRAWTAYAICNRFGRLKEKLGTRFAAYDIRHGFCQKHWEAGTDHLTVAELMGHVNGQMVAQVYSHMNQADNHLKEALERPNQQ